VEKEREMRVGKLSKKVVLWGHCDESRLFGKEQATVGWKKKIRKSKTKQNWRDDTRRRQRWRRHDLRLGSAAAQVRIALIFIIRVRTSHKGRLCVCV